MSGRATCGRVPVTALQRSGSQNIGEYGKINRRNVQNNTDKLDEARRKLLSTHGSEMKQSDRDNIRSMTKNAANAKAEADKDLVLHMKRPRSDEITDSARKRAAAMRRS